VSAGRVAIVTGGSRGIGRAVSLALAHDGVRVVVNYNRDRDGACAVEKSIRDAGGECMLFRADVSRETDVGHMVDGVLAAWGSVHVLVNNAGVTEDLLLLSMTEEAWDRVIDVNLKGTFLCTRFVSKIMMEQHYGRIVNVSSVAAVSPGRGQSNYAASKGGVESFTRAVAVEFARKGITVNAVSPGVIETDMTRRVRELGARELETLIPMRRVGAPEDVAHLVCFLASDHAAYITGQVVCVDGGMSVR
jgi:3-oxoacyl-[acyl-carrier protein] reductase